jgi:dipeptidase E
VKGNQSTGFQKLGSRSWLWVIGSSRLDGSGRSALTCTGCLQLISAMKLVFYSDQIIPENRRIDTALVAMLPSKARIGFVPSGGDPTRKWFLDRRAYYAEVGLDLAHSHDPATDDQESLAALLCCDAVHLSGGNTKTFLNRLVRADMIRLLREYARRGGVLIGTSAGAILLTPTISVDALFSGNDPERVNDEALSLSEFEFFPHLGNDPSYLPRLLKYSRACSRAILACPDGCGVILQEKALRLIGDGLVIKDGSATAWQCSQ